MPIQTILLISFATAWLFATYLLYRQDQKIEAFYKEQDDYDNLIIEFTILKDELEYAFAENKKLKELLNEKKN